MMVESAGRIGVESMRCGRSPAAFCPRLPIGGIVMKSRKTSRWLIGLATSTGLSSDASERRFDGLREIAQAYRAFPYGTTFCK